MGRLNQPVVTLSHFWSSDFLAQAVMQGQENQSPFVSHSHETSAASFKAWGRGGAEPERWTLDGLWEACRKYEAQQGARRAVTGVTGAQPHTQ